METGAFSGFDLSLHGNGTAVVTFNEPDRLNAMTRATKRDLIETLLQAQMDDKVRTVVFTGTGRAFVAGDDVNRQRQQEARPRLVAPLPYGDPQPLRSYDSLRSASQLLNKTILHLDKITIAAINGYAIQSGLSLALACDFRIASPRAFFAQPELSLGILAGAGGNWRLAQLVGLATARRMLYAGARLDATSALAAGLVDEVADDLPARGAALAVTIAQRSWRALELTKLALRAHRQDTTNFDTAAQALLFDSADKYERMTTFLERKKALSARRSRRGSHGPETLPSGAGAVPDWSSHRDFRQRTGGSARHDGWFVHVRIIGSALGRLPARQGVELVEGASGIGPAFLCQRSRRHARGRLPSRRVTQGQQVP